MALLISTRTRQKLTGKHNVARNDIVQCFINRWGGYLLDSREEHKTDPPTKWFVSCTDPGRILKVVFIEEENGDVRIKTCYEANEKEKEIYCNFFPPK
jgi:uncharacterized DUF497 family protein